MASKRDYQTLRPGILVALKTSVHGGVKFLRQDISRAEDRTIEKWETTRLCDDPEDYDRAVGARSLAGAEIRRVCSQTSFGLLCPQSKEQELNEAIARAGKIAAAHNTLSGRTEVRLFVVKGRVATDDIQAAEAIASDVGDMIERMDEAVARMDPDAIRKSAAMAKQMLQVLSDDKAAVATTAIEAARKVARTIVKRITNGGEDAAKVMADLQKEKGALAAARLSFIDVADEHEPAPSGEALPGVNLQRMADVEPEQDVAAVEPVAVPQIDAEDFANAEPSAPAAAATPAVEIPAEIQTEPPAAPASDSSPAAVATVGM